MILAVGGDEDLQAIYRLSRQVYGEAAVDLDTRRRWSQLFPDGNWAVSFVMSWSVF
jgi:hypothetical protein